MTNIVNKNLQPARSTGNRAEDIGNLVAGVILAVVAVGIFAFSVVAAVDPGLLMGLPK